MDTIAPEPSESQAQANHQGSVPETKQRVDLAAGKNVSDPKPVGKLVLDAIRVANAQSGTSLRDIKKVLGSKYQLDVKDKDADIKMFLNDAISRGALTKVDGKYKVAERARRRRSRGATSGGRKRSRSRKRSTAARRRKRSAKRSSRRKR